MRSVHVRAAFVTLDNLIDRHYIMNMRQKMEKVYVLLEKNLDTKNVRIEGVYETLKKLEDQMWFLMDFNEEQKYYMIEEMDVQ
jgi:Ni,Fe-hydrogenase I cytochrome b subunit